MGSLVSHIFVCLLVLSQPAQPLLACGCEPEVYYASECGSTWTACESYVPCCTEEFISCGDCEISESIIDAPQESVENKPSQATAEPLTPSSEEPKAKLPAPTAEKPTPIKPAAPIAVPQPEEEVAPPTDDLFPGPVPQADEAPIQLEPEKKSDIDELFEEPSAISEPQPLPSNETTTPPADSTEALFVEPQQDPEQAPAEVDSEVEETITEEETAKSEPPSETDSEAETIDDLFGPTDKQPESKEETPAAPYDPFGRIDKLPMFDTGYGFSSSEPRLWTDRSARFTCQAHLLSMTADHVVLEKVLGDQILVPLSRLSDTDLTFVKEQVHAQRTLLAREALAAQLAASWSD